MTDAISNEQAKKIARMLKVLTVRMQEEGLIKGGDNVKNNKLFQEALSLYSEEAYEAILDHAAQQAVRRGDVTYEDVVAARVVLRLKRKLGK